MILHDRNGALVTTLAATAYVPVHAINVRLLAFSGRTYAGNPHLAAALPIGAALSLLDHDDRCHGLPGGTSSARASPLSSGVLENQFDALNTQEQ